ncbi:VIT family protein [Hoeflea sp. AS60]|uniref:VIT1/CCC1 transporter family protein n=1 Tax=Hoeflea sp. AS60 TaxID=3135780 RepID=UPI0031728EEC
MSRLHSENHSVHKIGWLRAAVMGANDGIVSIASLVLGVATASAATGEVLTAGIAGLVAGSMSMAAGEYVSVSSQADTENADLARERRELVEQPDLELQELAESFIARGVAPDTALSVARQLTAKDALGAHAKEELGISDLTSAQPLQAAIVSAFTFAIGAAPPIIAVLVSPPEMLMWSVVISTVVVLAVLGGLGAKAGGASVPKGIARVTFWGIVAMAITSGVGYVFGAVV